MTAATREDPVSIDAPELFPSLEEPEEPSFEEPLEEELVGTAVSL